MLLLPSLEALGHVLSLLSTQPSIHALSFFSFLEKTGFPTSHRAFGNRLVSLLADSDFLPNAHKTFDHMLFKSGSSWNSLIHGYIRCGQSGYALMLYKKMQEDEESNEKEKANVKLKRNGKDAEVPIHPDEYNFVSLLKVCAKLKDIETGSKLHAHMAKLGFLSKNCFLGSALVDMYAKCGLIEKAHHVLISLPVRDVVIWTALIGGYVQHERCEEALLCFEKMRLEGISPNSYTFTCSLKACASIGAIHVGKEIHAQISKQGLLLKGDLVLGNALVDMYAKCGLLRRAKDVFDELFVRDVVTWTALIAGYVQHGYGEEALKCLEQMRRDRISPNSITLSSSLKACGLIGAKDKGIEIHNYITRKGLLEKDVVLGTALVDMYAKCGLLAKAQRVFDTLPVRDVVLWNSLITGHARLGEIEDVLCLFERMRREGGKPNSITFVSVLNACSHGGLIERGHTYFEYMTKDSGITPTIEHHTCMVDLLGRAGQIERAIATMKKTTFHPNVVLWLTVLGSCRKWRDLELGRHAFEEVIKLDDKEAGAYVCMANMYVDANMQKDAIKIEAMRVRNEAWKARKLEMEC